MEFGGLTLGKKHCEIVQGQLVARLDHLEHDFRFQVKVHDAESPWYQVKVLPPPVLVPLDGRSTPQVRLHYPAYTDLGDQDLEDGSGNIDAVAGTSATLRAATDRAVAHAWIEYRPEAPLVHEAAFLGLLGSQHPASLLALTACGRQIWERVPVRLGPTGRELAVDFLPRVTGTYALHFEDEAGLAGTRRFNLRVFPDPPPVVNLKRPSRSRDSLDLLPGADVHVQVSAEDTQYGLRSVFLEYRCKDEPARQVSFYDHRSSDLALAQFLTALAPAPLPSLMPAIAGSGLPVFRPQRLQLARVLSLQQVQHADGSGLREGDVVILQACADDFDDVSVDKPAARSHEIELRIVGPAALQTTLNQVQAQVQQELLRLRKMQQEAVEHVIAAQQQWQNTGRLRPKDVDHLLQAEQLQQQIRARVGQPEEGLRADVNRALRSFSANHLPRLRRPGTDGDSRRGTGAAGTGGITADRAAFDDRARRMRTRLRRPGRRKTATAPSARPGSTRKRWKTRSMSC